MMSMPYAREMAVSTTNANIFRGGYGKGAKAGKKKAGVDIPTIQAILRHKSPNTTARYVRSLGFVDDTLVRVFGEQKESPRSSNSEG